MKNLRIILISLLLIGISSPALAASGASIDKEKGYFQTPGSAGDKFIETGFDPDLVTFRITSTNPEFNTTVDERSSNGGGDFGIGHGFAECTGNSCDEVSQADAAGSSSTNGHVSASTDDYSIFQPITDSNGDNFEGFINGTVSATNSSGFNVTFDSTHDEQQYVVYTAYEFSSGADVSVGSFRTRSSTGTQSIDAGINPNFVHTVTSPTINDMNYFESTGNGGNDHGWNLGWAAKRSGDTLEQITMTTTLYSKDPDSHVWSSSDSQLLDTLWKQDSGDINGRLDAEVTGFDSEGFDLDYSTVDPHSVEGDRFLVTYFAVKTQGKPEVGFSDTPTATGTDFVETDVEMDSVNFFASNTIPDSNSEGYSGNNNANNHWGWMFGGGNSSSQRSMGFGTHSNSVNGHSAASSNISAFRLLYTDQDGNTLGEDRASIDKINETGFQLDWKEITDTNTDNAVRFDSVTFAYYGFSQPDYRTSEYLRTYRDEKPRSFYHEGENVTMETTGSFSQIPSISVSNGTHKVGGGQMESVSGVYRFNYTVNSSIGWYNVSINDEEWENAFYRGESWQGNYTDADGNKYTFRKKINFTETADVERWFEPVNRNISFSYGPSSKSVRLVAYNGTDNLEIPSQIVNSLESGTDLQWAEIAFFTSLNRSETRDYYVMSAKKNYSRDYESGFSFDTSGDKKTVTATSYETVFDISQGGLMSQLKDLLGTNKTLEGQEPIDRYPQVEIGLNTLAARLESDPSFTLDKGPVFTEIDVSGDASEDTSKPYEFNCDLYAATDYFTCEKNFSTTTSEEFRNLYMDGLLFSDGDMEWASYRTPSGISTDSLTGGNGNDITGISDQADWITFYNNYSSDGVAEIFLNSSFSATNNEEFRIFDDQGNDYFQHRVIDSQSVSANDYFYTETARLTYSGLRNYTEVNETFTQLTNDLNFTAGDEKTSDTEKPTLLDNLSTGTKDNESVTFSTYWEDDTFLDRAEINVTGNGVNGSDTVLKYEESRDIRDDGLVNKSWVNVTLSASEVNAGTVTANITVTDISGKSNISSTTADLSDETAPEFDIIVNDPGTKAGLDPGIQVNITANITDYTDVKNATLYHRYYDESSGSWNSHNTTNMSFESSDDFKEKYDSNFTAEEPGNYSYYVKAEDDDGNVRNSSETDLLIENDTTWEIIPSFEDTTATYDTNTSAGNFTLNNTGDESLTLNITADFQDRLWLNNSLTPLTKTLSAGESTLYNLTARTRDASEEEGTDNFTVTVKNSSTSPDSNSSSFIVTTSTGGPFLDPSITAFDPEVTQGDSDIRLEGETVNRGNETANETYGEFILPDGWSFTAGNSSQSANFTVDPDGSFTFETYVNASSSADTGDQTLEYFTKSNTTNRSAFETVTVNELSSDDESESSSGSSGGGSSGSSSGGFGGGGFGEPNEPEELVRNQTTKVELVRGRASGFSFEFVNPYEEEELKEVSITASGLLSQYIVFEPNEIDSIPANSSVQIKVSVNAPSYFDIGTHRLYFNLEGLKNTTSVTQQGNITIRRGETERLSSQKEVIISVREYSTEKATKFLNQSRALFRQIESFDVGTREAESILDGAEQAFEQKDYGRVEQSRDRLREQLQQLRESEKVLEALEKNLSSAEKRGISVSQSSRMVRLARQARDRGDLQTAISRLDEARNLYQLETKGAFNPIYFLESNWKIISVLGFFALIFSSSSFVVLRLKWLERKIKNLEQREKALQENMMNTQKQALQEHELSLDEYEDRLEEYSENLIQSLETRIALESKRASMLKIGRAEEQLKMEREKLIRMMEQDQERYYQSKDISKRIFKDRYESLQERLSEVEEDLAEIKTGKGFFSKFMRFY